MIGLCPAGSAPVIVSFLVNTSLLVMYINIIRVFLCLGYSSFIWFHLPISTQRKSHCSLLKMFALVWHLDQKHTYTESWTVANFLIHVQFVSALSFNYRIQITWMMCSFSHFKIQLNFLLSLSLFQSKMDPQLCSECKTFLADAVSFLSNQTFEVLKYCIFNNV